MPSLTRLLRRAPRPPNDTPIFDPWHGTNPVFLHELRAMRATLRALRRGVLQAILRIVFGLVFALAAAFGLFLLVQWIATAPDPPGALLLTCQILFAGMWLMQQWQVSGTMSMTVLGHTAPAVTRERERGTWELLRITTLDTRRIVWGKLLAGVQARSSLLAGIVAYVAVELAALAVAIALGGSLLPPAAWLAVALGALAGLPELVAACFAAAAEAVAVSSWLRSSGLANALGSGLLLGTHVLAPAVTMIVALVPAFATWDPAVAPPPAWIVLVYPLGVTLIYALLTAIFVRIAVAGADRSA